MSNPSQRSKNSSNISSLSNLQAYAFWVSSEPAVAFLRPNAVVIILLSVQNGALRWSKVKKCKKKCLVLNTINNYGKDNYLLLFYDTS